MNKCLYCDSLSLEQFLIIVNSKKYNYCDKCSFEIDTNFIGKIGKNYYMAYLIDKKYLCHTFYYYYNNIYEFYYNYDEFSCAKDVINYSSLNELNIFLYKYLKNIIFI